MLYALAMLIGVIGGLRAMSAPAAISWAAAHGLIPVEGSWLSFFGWRYTPWVFTLLALAELVTDQLPATPSRKTPPQFGTRIIIGALCGAAISMAGSMAGGMAQIGALTGAVLGVTGAVIGTLGGAAVRSRLAAAFGSDRPAAIIEDVVAIGGAALIVFAL